MGEKKFLGVKIGLFLVVVLAGIFWLIFYAPFLANISQIIPVRNAYFDQLDKLGAWDSIFYTARPVEIRQGKFEQAYKYKFVGKFARFEYTDNVLVVKDKNGKEWKFRYKTDPIPKDNEYLRGATTSVTAKVQ